jgi:CDGSH-type Zn-finger protein
MEEGMHCRGASVLGQRGVYEAIGVNQIELLGVADAGMASTETTEQMKEDNMSDVIITPKNDGPYYIKGSFKIMTEGGREIASDGNEVWLCRCGQSANKPFCDSAHKTCGFQSVIVAFDLPAPKLAP